ncbi:MAG TPA: ABC transporter ATP-binding protein [bacterium]|nr:ABC transporter ATP-binding protein [bacterium]
MSIKFKKVNKSLNGQVVLRDITFSVDNGQCLCILGENGSGKTTLINLLCDILTPDSGSVFIDNTTYQENPRQLKKRIGVLPQPNPAIPQFTGRQYLEFVSILYGVPREQFELRVEGLTPYLFSNPDDLHKQIASYSRGMRQRIAFGAAFIHQPTYVFLDEPFAGLDPVRCSRLIEFLQSYINNKRALVIASHLLPYVRQIATHISVLDQTELVYFASIESFKAEASETVPDSLLHSFAEPTSPQKAT